MKLLHCFTLLLLVLLSVDTSAQIATTPPANPSDCILDAPDLTSFISSGILPDHGWTCGMNTTVLAAPLSASPATLTLTDDDTRNCDRLTTAPLDAWYKFTAGSNTEAWLTFFRGDANINTTVALYKQVTAPAGTCTTTSGTLEFVDCSDGGAGGARDVAECTMIEDRIDVSGLTAGTVYYIRMWERAAATEPAAPIDFYLCAERNAPIFPAVDKCEDLPHITPVLTIGASIGCASSPAEGRDYTIKYTNQSNVGATGRIAGAFVDNNAVTPCQSEPRYTGNGTVSATNTLGQLDYDCNGGVTAAVGGNTALNANVMYAIFIEACSSTATTATVTIDNMTVIPEGASLQVNLLGPLLNDADNPHDEQCANNPNHIVSFGVNPLVNSCVSFSNPAQTLNQTFILYIEGSDGALVKFDMELDVDYEGCTPEREPCDAALGGGTVVGSNDALSLEWGAFEGRAEDNHNAIEWITLTEVENEYFEILRSADGRKFRKIDHVSGHGTTKEMKSYLYIDNAPLADAYYQLRTVSTSGEETYSEVIRINRDNEVLDINNIYPIPARDKVRVDFTAKNTGTAQFSITDMYGRLMSQSAVSAAAGINTKTLDVSNYSTGIYYLTVEHDGVRQVRKIVRK